MRRLLLASCALAMVVIVPMGVMSLIPQKLAIFSPAPTPTPDLFSPAYYGVPDTIAGHKVLAVISAQNSRCVPSNTLTLIVRVGAADPQSYLSSDEARDLNAAMKEFDHPGMFWSLNVIGPEVSLDNMQAEIEQRNELLKKIGCLNQDDDYVGITATPVPEQGPH